MAEGTDTPSGPTILTLPLELRLLIYAHLTRPALIHGDADYDCRSRRFYRDVYQKDLPETKLIYFTLHALSATCCTFHLEMEDPIAAVRAVLAKQKYYLQSHMVMMEFQWMKSSGITWVELERQNGIAGGPDFTEGWEDIRVRGDVAADRYPEGIYLLAEAKRWDNWMRDEKVKNEAREGCGE